MTNATTAGSALAYQAATQPPASLKGDMLKSTKAIADFLDLPEQQVSHLCRTGQLPGVFKLGRLYHARKSALIAHMARLEQGGA